MVFGTILAPGQRTVAAALRAVGLRDDRHFTTYRRVLNRAQWSPLRLSRLLLGLVTSTLLAANAPIILLVDSTLVRRTGRRIVWKGRFHDAVRWTWSATARSPLWSSAIPVGSAGCD